MGQDAGARMLDAAFSKKWRTKTAPQDDEEYRAWYGAKYVRGMAATVKRYKKAGKTDVTGGLELDLMVPPSDVRHFAKAVGLKTEGASDQWHVVATYAGLAKRYNAEVSEAYRDEELVTYRAGTDREYAARLYGALLKGAGK